MPPSSAVSLCAALTGVVACAVLPLGAAWLGECGEDGAGCVTEECGEDGAGCVTEDDHPALLQVFEPSAALASLNLSQATLPPEPTPTLPPESAVALSTVNASTPTLPSEPAMHPETSLALATSNQPQASNPDWFYPRWDIVESPLRQDEDFWWWEYGCKEKMCTNGSNWFTGRVCGGDVGACFCCHRDLIIRGVMDADGRVVKHPELAMKWCFDNRDCAGFTISKTEANKYYFGKWTSPQYRKKTYSGYMTCSKHAFSCLAPDNPGRVS